MMGDAKFSSWASEHLLIVLWFDEPLEIIKDIRHSFPGLNVTYFQQLRDEDDDLRLKGDIGVPKGSYTNETRSITQQEG